jgi:hypothetical protein
MQEHEIDIADAREATIQSVFVSKDTSSGVISAMCGMCAYQSRAGRVIDFGSDPDILSGLRRPFATNRQHTGPWGWIDR